METVAGLMREPGTMILPNGQSIKLTPNDTLYPYFIESQHSSEKLVFSEDGISTETHKVSVERTKNKRL